MIILAVFSVMKVSIYSLVGNTSVIIIIVLLIDVRIVALEWLHIYCNNKVRKKWRIIGSGLEEERENMVYLKLGSIITISDRKPFKSLEASFDQFPV